MHRQHDLQAREEIAIAITAQARHTFAGQAEDAPILRLRRNGERHLAPVQQRYRRLAAQHGRHQVYFEIEINIVALALVQRIGLDADDQEEIAARAAADTRLTLARDANLGAVIDPGRKS